MLTTLSLCLFVGTCLLTPAVHPQSSRPPEKAPLVVSVDWLAQHLDDGNLVLLHVGDRAEYEATHIPGALFLPMSEITTPLTADPMFELLPPDRLRKTFEKLGAGDDSRIVVCFGKELIQAAARVMLTLDYLGLGPRSSMLDGGMAAWRAAGNPLTPAVRTPTRGKITTKVRDDLVVDLARVRTLINQPGYVLVDARLPNFYRGESAGRASRPGHIPGAVNLPYSSLFDESLKLKSPPELEALFREAGIRPGSKVVTYCHIGQTASLVYLVARYLGFDASLYDGSFTEWSSKPELPVDK